VFWWDGRCLKRYLVGFLNSFKGLHIILLLLDLLAGAPAQFLRAVEEQIAGEKVERIKFSQKWVR
jgi:hypothetical protein